MHFTCPYCQKAQIVQGSQLHHEHSRLTIGKNAEGPLIFVLRAIRCANPDCAKTTLSGQLHVEGKNSAGQIGPKGLLERWALLPNSCARHLPDCIPQPIREDYAEACLIRDLSPKASATLIRRCLQGMIRDFCGISDQSLIKEIKTLRSC